MRDRMAARGPDDATQFRHREVAFGHRRLAIRDAAGGRQPWVSDDDRYVLIYNGEIYNDDVLRYELQGHGVKFRTQCDTEVLMAAWQTWGAECTERLRGMFAFGVYDFHQRELFLARDRCGVKPLFYSQVGGEFVFASSIASITEHPDFQASPNLTTVGHYLSTLRLTLDDETVFSGVHTVRPAEQIRVNDSGTEASIYWTPPPQSLDDDLTFDEAAEQLEATLRESVAMRMRSDVPVGMMLSGGVDSSTLACLVKDETGQSMVARCGGGESVDVDQPAGDFEFAQQCAKHTGFDFQAMRVSSSDYHATWQTLIESYETPVSTPTDVIIHRVAKGLKPHVGVALGGEGADEACCGYSVPHWSGNDFDLSRTLENLSPTQATVAQQSLVQQYGCDTFDSPGQHYLLANGLISAPTQEALFADHQWESVSRGGAVQDYYDGLFGRHEGMPTSQRTAHVLMQTNLESLLSRLDSATMSAGLESRVPYTDHVLIEQLFRLPHSYRIDIAPSESTPWRSSMDLAQRGALRSKRLIRKVAGRVMPPALADRPKASFPTPLVTWIDRDWKQWIDQTVRNSSFANEVFDPRALRELAHLPSQMAMWNWPIVNTILWGQRWFG